MNLINITNINQKNLYGHDKIFYELSNLYNKKKLPKKIILSGPKGIGKSTLSYHLINYIFSKSESNKYSLEKLTINDKNRSFNLVKNNTHPNFYLIDVAEGKKNIEIEQIRQMITFCNKSSFNNQEKIILIDNVDKLNLNAVNALLKKIEEPNDNIFFILILDSNKKILETLKSRCIKFNLFFSFNESLQITNKIINQNLKDLINPDIINYYSSPGHNINLINFSIKNDVDILNINLEKFLLLLIDNSYYKKDKFINNNIYQYLEFYLLKLINKKNSKHIYFLYRTFIDKISNMHKYNLDQDSFFIEIKTKVFNG